MKQLGMGAMIHLLGGNEASVAAYTAAVGKTIAEAKIDGDDALRLAFTDSTGIRFLDDGQSCCECRYMRTDDDLNYHVGATLVSAEIRDAPEIEDEYGVHEVQFLVVTTSKGVITVANHNEHNGYYGGICVTVQAL